MDQMFLTNQYHSYVHIKSENFDCW